MGTYLFDFDGTLVDSMPTYAAMMLGILRENDVAHEKDIIKITTPLGYAKTAELFASMGLNKPVEEILSLMNERAVKAYTCEVPAKECVIDVLRRMKARGDDLNVLTAYTICLQTSGPAMTLAPPRRIRRSITWQPGASADRWKQSGFWMITSARILRLRRLACACAAYMTNPRRNTRRR